MILAFFINSTLIVYRSAIGYDDRLIHKKAGKFWTQPAFKIDIYNSMSVLLFT